MSGLADAALSYARRGWAVFPCDAAKRPLCESGVLEATTDEAQIRRWWAQFPRANIGFEPASADLMVLDFDPGSTHAELVRNVGALPDTLLKQATPRGGEHHFFALEHGEIVPPSASKLAAHVDVRSFHSYVLLPPSRTAEGSYAWLSEGRPAFRTDALVHHACAAVREKHAQRDTWTIEADLPENIALAVAWLQDEARIAVEGRGGDHTAYATAAMCKSFGLSPELAFDLMWQHWNPRCLPPWSGAEAEHLEIKIANAYAYNTSPPGNLTPAYRAQQTKALFKAQVTPLPSGREETHGRYRFTDRAGMAHIRPPEWLVEDLLPLGGYALLYGAPGTCKTFVALDLALSIASGFQAEATWRVAQPGKVLFCAGEGRPGIAKRVAAWEALHFGGCAVDGFILADPVPTITEGLEPFCAGALAMHPEGYRLVVIDTVGRALQGVNENAQEHASAFTALVEALQRSLGCAVLALHHSGKAKAEARGSSVFQADPDTVIRLEREGKGLEIELHMQKQKDAPEWERPRRLAMRQHLDSLVAMPCPVKTPAPGVERVEEARASFQKLALFEIVDKAIQGVLGANKQRAWATSALAQAVAMRPEIDLASETLRGKYLVPLRESKVSAAHRCYDAETKRWRWAG